MTLHTNASLRGHGGITSCGLSTSNTWASFEQQLHINILELLAILLSLIFFVYTFANRNVHIYISNMSCVYYINKFSVGKSLDMCHRSIHEYAVLQAIFNTLVIFWKFSHTVHKNCISTFIETRNILPSEIMLFSFQWFGKVDIFPTIMFISQVILKCIAGQVNYTRLVWPSLRTPAG